MHSGGKHLKYMLIAGAAVLAVLVLFGVPVGRALSFAAVLACPLMMIFMMRSMNSGDGQGHGGHGGGCHGGPGHDVPAHDHQPATVSTPHPERDQPPARR